MKHKMRNNNTKRLRNSVRVITLVLAAALISLAVTWHRKEHFIRTANLSEDRYRQCYQTSLNILKLLSAPKKAARNIISTNSIAKSLEQCAQKAAMPAKAISRIVPSGPRRVPKSDYVECQNRISLDNVELKQLCQFLWNIENEIEGLNISDLHIWFEDGKENFWQAEVTLAGISLVPRKRAESNQQVTKTILSEDK